VTTAARPMAALVLDVPPRLDYPNGYSGRYYHFLRRLSEAFSLRLVVPRLCDDPWTREDFLPPDLEVEAVHWMELRPNPLNERTTLGRARRLVHYLRSTRPYMAYPRALGDMATDFMEGAALRVVFLPHLAHLAVGDPATPSVVVLEEAWEKALTWGTEGLPAVRRRLVMRTEQWRVQRLRRALGRRVALAVAISEEEGEWFARHMPRERVLVIPHGIDCDYHRPRGTPEQDVDVAIIGVLSGGANVDGAMSFYEAAQRSTKGSRWRWAFVGRSPARALRALRSPAVLVVGDVPDVRPWYERSKAIIVPAGYGAGAKTTVLQAWAMGKPLVATRFALSGLPAKPENNVLVGKTPAELVSQVHRLLADDELRSRIGKAGRRTVEGSRDMAQIAGDFAAACADVAGITGSRESVANGRSDSERLAAQEPAGG
jgi:glycosyltransferase involved in cell wall biosynthesis